MILGQTRQYHKVRRTLQYGLPNKFLPPEKFALHVRIEKIKPKVYNDLDDQNFSQFSKNFINNQDPNSHV